MPKRPLIANQMPKRWCIWLPRRQRYLASDGTVNDRLGHMLFITKDEAVRYARMNLLHHSDESVRATRMTYKRVTLPTPLRPGWW